MSCVGCRLGAPVARHGADELVCVNAYPGLLQPNRGRRGGQGRVASIPLNDRPLVLGRVRHQKVQSYWGISNGEGWERQLRLDLYTTQA